MPCFCQTGEGVREKGALLPPCLLPSGFLRLTGQGAKGSSRSGEVRDESGPQESSDQNVGPGRLQWAQGGMTHPAGAQHRSKL